MSPDVSAIFNTALALAAVLGIVVICARYLKADPPVRSHDSRPLAIWVSMKKKFVLAIVLVVIAAATVGCGSATQASSAPSSAGLDVIASAFANQTSGVQVQSEGVVTSVLPDDNKGSRHQRFILQLANGQTLLMAHNIDIAPRLPALATGDLVAFNGQYEWNSKGGTVHWTHRDPSRKHQAGWLRFKGQTYQ